MWHDVIIYEQPLNEHMRACLRLENLFSQLSKTIDEPEEWATRHAMLTLLKILNVVDRPDLKAKLTKALSDHAAILTQLEKLPKVDTEKLRVFLDQLDFVIDELYALSGKIGQELHSHELLSSIRSHMHNPGGPCNFSLPAYQLWLKQPPAVRSHDLHSWAHHFALLQKAVELLLTLTRDFSKPQKHLAADGFYQQNLNSNQQGELVRVIVPSEYNIFPETSVGRHRLSIRFYKGDLTDKPQPLRDSIEFALLYCSL